MLVELVRGEDGRLGEARAVEHPAGLLREPGEVARVEADADHLLALRPQPPPRLDGVRDAIEGGVGVHQEHAVRREGAGVGEERLALGVVEHHPAVRVGALHRDPVQPAGEGVGGRLAAADVGGPRGSEPAVDPLGAAHPELDHRRPAGGVADARGLGGDERLEVEDREEGRLDQHARHHRAGDAQERLVGEEHRPLRHRVDVHLHGEVAQDREEPGVEERRAVPAPLRREVGEVLLAVPPRLDEIHDVLEPGGDGEPAFERVAAERHGERRLARSGAVAPGGVCHGELVEVGQEPEGGPVQLRGDWHARSRGSAEVYRTPRLPACRRGARR